MIEAVLFDLDDTLFPQSAWLDGAWLAVARRAAAAGASESDLHRALVSIAAQGTDQGRIIDRALARIGRTDLAVPPLVDAFRGHAPRQLTPYPGVADGLRALRRRAPIGLVTDGDPVIQRAKLDALGLDSDFDVIVCSDELGRAHRKPDPAPFRTALASLDCASSNAVFVGDRPAKDVVGAHAVGMRAMRVLTGEWAGDPDVPPAWRCVPDAAAACLVLLGLVATRRDRSGTSAA